MNFYYEIIQKLTILVFFDIFLYELETFLMTLKLF